MRAPVEIENIEEMRRRAGIEDVELRVAIRGLQVGDFVRVTLRANTKSSETLLVRVTSIRGSAFRGKLVHRPASAGLANLRAGSPVAFTPAHIHSLVKRGQAPGR
jgi:hypothetical protein